jgi:DNA-directed RNA polymerase specialized sigma24 family protein
MSLYARHEDAVLRFFMERVRSPALACDLTAETFATALEQTFDPSRQTEAAWVLGLADEQLLRAYRDGAVDDDARTRLKLRPVVLDDRTLDRVWQLRGIDRDDAPKPRPSGQVVVGRGESESSGEARRDRLTRRDDALLPAVADAIAGAERRRHGGRTRRRKLVIAARVAIALVTVAWVVGEAAIPDRPAAASGSWLPYEDQGVGGEFPRTWFMAHPPDTGALATFTTFETGTGARCGALATLGDRDVLVSVVEGRPRPPAKACVGEAHAIRRPIRDGLWVLIVTGPRTPEAARAEAGEIAERVRRPA